MLGVILFNILFYGITAFLVIFTLPFIIIPGFAFWMAKIWACLVCWLLRTTVGTKTVIKGIPPTTPSLILSKHQSAWETIAFNHILKRPAFILKEELMWIPFFGLFLKKTGMIALDRRGHIHALKKMIKDSQHTLSVGRSVILFPEGTRSAPGSKGSYKKGAFLLYKKLNISVVPVALNSGVCWPRRTFIKHKGTITVSFLPPIAPGLSEEDFMHKIESVIEKESRALFLEAEKMQKN